MSKKKKVICDNCNHRGIDGGPSPAMVCEHPDVPDSTWGYIIKWDERYKHRISYQCPKLKGDH